MNFPGSKIRQKQKRQDLVTVLLILIVIGIVVVIILGVVFLIVRPLRPGNPDNAAENLIKSARDAGVPITPEEKLQAEAEKEAEAEKLTDDAQSENPVPEINDNMPLENSIPELNISIRPASGAKQAKSTKPEKKQEAKKTTEDKTKPTDPGVSQEGKIPPPPPAQKAYKIDLGSYTEETEVKAKVTELKNMGLNPRIDKISETEFVLSVTERFDSIDYATALRDKLIEQGFTNARLKTD